MVKIVREVIFKHDLRQLIGKTAGEKLKFFWQKGWKEIPEIMIMIPPFIVSLFGMRYVIKAQAKEEKLMARYFNNIKILRADDPNVARIRKDKYFTIDHDL